MPSQSNLKSVDDYNAEMLAKRRARERVALMTGVACPKCGGELEWAEIAYVGLTWPLPTTRKACCPKDSLSVELQLP